MTENIINKKAIIKPRTFSQIEAAKNSNNFEAHCEKCFRPKKTCYCKYITPINTGIKFVFLMHPKEAYKQKTGTGRLAHLTLIDSEIIVGIDFSQNKRVNALINDKNYFPLVLYPAQNAFTAETFAKYASQNGILKNEKIENVESCKNIGGLLGENISTIEKIEKIESTAGENIFQIENIENCCERACDCENILENAGKNSNQNKKLLIFVIDSTWFFAKKMLRLSPNVKGLQKLSFTNAYRSQFKFKTQPSEECLSTIESCYYLIKELQAVNLAKNCDIEPLMDIFKRMVDFQIQSQIIREQSGEPDRYQASGSIRAKKRLLRKQTEEK